MKKKRQHQQHYQVLSSGFVEFFKKGINFAPKISLKIRAWYT